MLVLSRKPLESILIPELNIRITVLSVGQQRVKIGVTAPPEIDITRPEYRPTTPAVAKETAAEPTGSMSFMDVEESSDLLAMPV